MRRSPELLVLRAQASVPCAVCQSYRLKNGTSYEPVPELLAGGKSHGGVVWPCSLMFVTVLVRAVTMSLGCGSAV